MESCLPKKERTSTDTGARPADNEVIIIEVGPLLEEHSLLPEENELKDDHSEPGGPLRPGIPLSPGVTYNGNVVAQEDGKREALSRQESQANSF